MDDEKRFNLLLQILSSEQQISQRTDQKAFTLISLIGVFTVFFIIHYTKIVPSVYNSIIIFTYFFSVLIALVYLVIVISPRITGTEETLEEDKKALIPTFFGGISKYKSAEDYAASFKTLMDNPDRTYHIFAKSVYSIGRINNYKNKFLRYGIYWFVIAIGLEFLIIVSLYVSLLIGK